MTVYIDDRNFADLAIEVISKHVVFVLSSFSPGSPDTYFKSRIYPGPETDRTQSAPGSPFGSPPCLKILPCRELVTSGFYFIFSVSDNSFRGKIRTLSERADRLHSVRERIARACERAGRRSNSVRLVAVTKTHPAATLQELIDLGVRDLGENRVQEIQEKVPGLSGEYTMHLIGHLQTNKVGKVLPLVQWIQSIDRLHLVDAIDKRREAASGEIQALVEVNTTGEESKHGCSPSDVRRICERVKESSVLRLRGLMTIGPLGGDETQVRKAFATLRELADSLNDLCTSPELSMGMSSDFEWAIEEGATIVRVGSVLVGTRDY